MKIIAFAFPLLLLTAGQAFAEPQAASGDKSNLDKLMGGLSGLLSSTNPKTSEELENVAPAAGTPAMPDSQPASVPVPNFHRNDVENLPPLPSMSNKVPVQTMAVPVPTPPSPPAYAVPLDNNIDNSAMLSPSTKNLLRGTPKLPKTNQAKGKVSISRGGFDPELEADQQGSTITASEPATAPSKLDIKVQSSRKSESTYTLLDDAQNALSVGQYEVAIGLYKKALKAEPKNRDGLFGLATAYHKSGQRQQAKDAYTKLLKAYPGYVQGLNNVVVFASEEAPNSALKELDALTRRSPDFAPAYAQKAVIYSQRDDAFNAKKNLIKAVELDPENLTYKYNLAVLLDNLGEFDNAAKFYAELVEASNKGGKLPVNETEVKERLAYISAQPKQQM